MRKIAKRNGKERKEKRRKGKRKRNFFLIFFLFFLFFIFFEGDGFALSFFYLFKEKGIRKGISKFIFIKKETGNEESKMEREILFVFNLLRKLKKKRQRKHIRKEKKWELSSQNKKAEQNCNAKGR